MRTAPPAATSVLPLSHAGAACALALFASSCFVVRENGARVQLDLDAATQFNVRGTPEVATGVVQGATLVSFDTKDGGKAAIGAFANVNMRDDVGDAWYPDGAAGDVTEAEYSARYGHRYGNTQVDLALTNYTLTQGSEFVLTPAQSVRGATNEVSVQVAQIEAFAGITPRIEMHYDYDEVSGVYWRGGLARTWQLSDTVALDADLHLGWSSAAQSFWNYGLPESGVSDVGGELRARYTISPGTTLKLYFGGSRIVDSTLRDWFNLLSQSGLPLSRDNEWVGLGLTWTF